MQAEIITIGDEILIGQIIDSNSAFISKELNKIGVSVYQITSVQDDREHILKSLREAEDNADLIIMTGGLGPTKDDITKKTIAEYFNDSLEEDISVRKNIEHIWEVFVKKPLMQVNIDQALVPSKSQVLMNKYGSAPGMWLEKNNNVFISLPGVPYEMKALMIDEVLPKLRSQFNFPFIMHKTFLTYGMGESMVAERIEAFEDNLPEFIKLAYLPSLGRVRLRLSAKGMDKMQIESEMEKQTRLLLPQIEDIFSGFEEDISIEAIIGKYLTQQERTVATAESCTGGLIAERFTANAGASKYFKGSIVSYTKETKVNVLGVSEVLINEHSVVSAEVAEAMAERARILLNTDFAVATTGNAGPTKDDTAEDLGIVYIAIATKNGTYSEKHSFGNHRVKVINKAANKAFELLQKEILKK
ncbi:competence/damage-inducible protein A [Psychroserpens sp.]|uniref:competence/damage-inducible protein A n=1 Tax=Psychroserpens sp. TaxID=2020870 RepID=UPI001B01F8E4|nr:competence/damage-inducible protein A [Psychroserpens sp.]MBO6606887.1 competence/damage-inducible protein A [Psychroserpens sp.]MBO6630569.1 competence/damage-inducible protein A [Psychroserpens sp.]MBO6654033.1 competence/damage-inducible protein A [Psychroserpens sp.]MBO6682681.1 competence/damage-inducible protein A [Psychroserpens sp.]MBO6750659.1 competence/damage-inducible protein A [Psychroserpens sp.]